MSPFLHHSWGLSGSVICNVTAPAMCASDHNISDQACEQAVVVHIASKRGASVVCHQPRLSYVLQLPFTLSQLA